MRKRRRQLQARTKRVLLRLALVCLAYLSALNGLVRLCGGSPALLSPRHLGAKHIALLQLGKHLALHPWRSCGTPPQPLLRRAAHHYRVPPAFVLAIAESESSLQPHRISHAGAMGIMQLVPSTARELRVADPFDQKESIEAGTRYLARLWRYYGGDERRVAAAYNVGIGGVPQSGPLRLPGETRLYVQRVIKSRI